ncbi:MAG: hypothetical protein ABSB32_21440 [Thermodesulfobacteriota bacterium]
MELPGSADGHCKRPKPVIPPYLPEGYRLPTYAEYEAISSMQSEAERLGDLIAVATGDLKKDLIRQRTDIVHEYFAMIDANDIYFVPGSNYFKGV